jgi:hypothetical protein
MSPSRQQAPLPEGLPEAVRTLLMELRALKEESGYDLRTLEHKTHASRSSWGRWLSGETWIPVESAGELADLCGGDRRRLEILWELAEQARRTAGITQADPGSTGAPAERGQETGEAGRQTAAPGATSGEGKNPASNVTRGTGGTATASTPGDCAASVTVERPPSVRSGHWAGLVTDHPVSGAWGTRRLFLLGAAAVSTVTAVVASVVIGAALGPRPHVAPSSRPASSSRTAHPAATLRAISRSQVIARAWTWHPHSQARIPYDQAGSYQGYRTDGSGYASMTLGLPQPGPTSGSLAGGVYSRPIPMAQLQGGDLVINATGDAGVRQVVIFEKWADPGRGSYWAFQQRRGYGTDHLVLREGLGGSGNFNAYRPRNIRTDAAN